MATMEFRASSTPSEMPLAAASRLSSIDAGWATEPGAPATAAVDNRPCLPLMPT